MAAGLMGHKLTSDIPEVLMESLCLSMQGPKPWRQGIARLFEKT